MAYLRGHMSGILGLIHGHSAGTCFLPNLSLLVPMRIGYLCIFRKLYSIPLQRSHPKPWEMPKDFPSSGNPEQPGKAGFFPSHSLSLHSLHKRDSLVTSWVSEQQSDMWRRLL